MEIIRTISELRARLAPEKSIAFVPTMGNLHAGHLDLLRIAKNHANCTVASIFVNRLQFGPNEDFDRYPRTFTDDCAKLQEMHVDILFCPDEQELYPVPQQMTVEPPAIAHELCGAYRPGHFRGVATVVLKLFNIVKPNVAVFGKKDYQQLFVIRQMLQQLNLDIEIIGGETVRESDGLAMSSRNRYLSDADRSEAPRLHDCLEKIKQGVMAGELNYPELCSAASDELTQHGWKVDYVEVRDADSLQAARGRKMVVLAAAWLGKTRLIDNCEICVRR